MSYLAVQVYEYLASVDSTATAIEQQAGLKRGTLDSIQRDQHPRPERFGQLLRAVDDTTARRWLIAYLRDDCPPEFLPRLEIVVRDQEGTLKEAAATYASEGPAAVLASWQRLQAAIEADTSLGRWFVKTVMLILGPVTPPTAVDAHLAAAARLFVADPQAQAAAARTAPPAPAPAAAPRSGGAPPRNHDIAHTVKAVPAAAGGSESTQEPSPPLGTSA